MPAGGAAGTHADDRLQVASGATLTHPGPRGKDQRCTTAVSPHHLRNSRSHLGRPIAPVNTLAGTLARHRRRYDGTVPAVLYPSHFRGEAAIHYPNNKKGSRRKSNNKGAIIVPDAQRGQPRLFDARLFVHRRSRDGPILVCSRGCGKSRGQPGRLKEPNRYL